MPYWGRRVRGGNGAWMTGWVYYQAMSESTEQLLKKVLSLGEKDRALLAGALIESLHGESDPGVESAWESEIQRRISELEAGAVKTAPWSEVRERLFRGYGPALRGIDKC